jgi:hypothetical protein
MLGRTNDAARRDLLIDGMRQAAQVLTSGYAGPSIREAEAEGLQVLGKPYRLDELAAALRSALHGMAARSSHGEHGGAAFGR